MRNPATKLSSRFRDKTKALNIMERAVMAICAWTVLTVIPPTRMSAADELKVYKCTRAASPPALDGRLDDVCWRGMDKTAVFTTEGGNPAQEQTTAMLVYGEDALYIGFECRESDMAGVAARVTSHDGPVWNDDCIEAFIDINNKSYYHFMANSLGTRYEEKGRDGSWNIDWQAAAGKEKNAWCVEMRIPFLSLDSIPEEGALWRLNLNREHHAGGKAELSSWSDTGGSFHAPDRFGYLVFNSYSACLRRIVPEYLEAKTKLFQLFKSYPGQSEKIRERLKPAIAKADELAGNCGILSTETTPGEFIGFLIPVLEVKEALATAPEKIIPAVVKGPYLQKLTENSAVIMWESNVKTSGRVDFGVTEALGKTVNSTGCTNIHEVSLTNLSPGQTYRYRVTIYTPDVEREISGDTYSFMTVPETWRPWRFAVCSDPQWNGRSPLSAWTSVAKGILEEKPSFVLVAGDLTGDSRNYDLWTGFFGPARDLFASVCLWPAWGNHDFHPDWLYKFFSLPNNENWYSFDYLNAHIIALDTYSDFTPGSEQYDWLIDDLRKTRAGWVFVFMHTPPYGSGPHTQSDSLGVADEKQVQNGRLYLDPVFQAYGVDAVFCGHNHHYERSRKDNVYYLITGGAGNSLYNKGDWNGNVIANANPYSQVFAAVNHYVIADIDRFNFTLTAKDSKGTVIDTVLKKRTCGKPAADRTKTDFSAEVAEKPVFIEKNAGLILSMHFDEGRGVVAWDTGMNRCRGVICNGSWVPGRKGEAVRLKDGWIDVLSPENFGRKGPVTAGDGITFSSWVRPDEIKDSKILLFNYPGGLTLMKDGLYWEYQRSDTKKNWGIKQPCCFEPGRWYHIAVTHDYKNNMVGFYVDGKCAGKKKCPPAVPLNEANLSFGYMTYRPQNSFNGTIDELKIFDRPLTEKEMVNIPDAHD